MILPDIVLPSRVNQNWPYSGIDSFESCLNKKHFESYPHVVTYQYNSRGFRDAEWPGSLEELQNSIWCIGDSFTVGIGSPLSHTWPRLLQQQTKIRTVNVGMDGASNDWISRRTIDIINAVGPKYLVLQWSYLHRREKTVEQAQLDWWQQYYEQVKDSLWPDCKDPKDFFNLPEFIQLELKTQHAPGPFYQIADEERRLAHSKNSHIGNKEDIENILQCVLGIENACANTKVLHSFIPQFVGKRLEKSVIEQIKSLSHNCLGVVKQIDTARDGHHYDLRTAQNFVDELVHFL